MQTLFSPLSMLDRVVRLRGGRKHQVISQRRYRKIQQLVQGQGILPGKTQVYQECPPGRTSVVSWLWASRASGPTHLPTQLKHHVWEQGQACLSEHSCMRFWAFLAFQAQSETLLSPSGTWRTAVLSPVKGVDGSPVSISMTHN